MAEVMAIYLLNWLVSWPPPGPLYEGQQRSRSLAGPWTSQYFSTFQSPRKHLLPPHQGPPALDDRILLKAVK